MLSRSILLSHTSTMTQLFHLFIYNANRKETHLFTHQCYWVVNTAIDNLGSSSHRDAFKRFVIPDSASNSVFGFQDSHLQRQSEKLERSKAVPHTQLRTWLRCRVTRETALRGQREQEPKWMSKQSPDSSEEQTNGLLERPLKHVPLKSHGDKI